MQGRIPDFAKTQGQKIRFALKPIWVRALRLIFGQIYITRPPQIHFFIKIFLNLVFQIFPVQANIWKVKHENRKSEMRNYKNKQIQENLGGL